MKKLDYTAVISKEAMVAHEAWLRANSGYPLKHIAERFNLPYGDVLLYADWVKYQGEPQAHDYHEVVARVRGALGAYNYATVYVLIAMQEANFRKPGWSQ